MSINALFDNPVIITELKSAIGATSPVNTFQNVTYTQFAAASTSNPLTVFNIGQQFDKGKTYTFQIGWSSSTNAAAPELLVATLTFGDGTVISGNFTNTPSSSMKTVVFTYSPVHTYSGSMHFVLTPATHVEVTVNDGYWMVATSTQ